MEKYYVLKQVDNYTPTVVRCFKDVTDATNFMLLLEKSEDADFIRHFVTEVI